MRHNANPWTLSECSNGTVMDVIVTVKDYLSTPLVCSILWCAGGLHTRWREVAAVGWCGGDSVKVSGREEAGFAWKNEAKKGY
ncbi:hypothetical protein AAZX31_19G168600 [Glycine max]